MKLLLLKEEIIEFSKLLLISDIGFFKNNINEDLPYGISVVVRLSDAIIDEIDKKPTHTYFNHYRSVNSFIDQSLLKIGFLLQTNGYKYITVAASQSIPDMGKYMGRYPHKTGAYLCGLGTIGKSGLFIHKQYGPAVRLGTILTDYDGTKGVGDLIQSTCKDCNKCVSACPAQALYGLEFDINNPDAPMLDYRACSEHMKKHFQDIGRGAVCGICINVCPKRYKSK